MRKAANAVLTAVTLAGATLSWAQSKELPVNWKDLPPPFHSESVRNRSEVIVRPEGAELRLPEGFAVEEYLSGFDRPRFMMLGPSGEILLTDSGSPFAASGTLIVGRDGLDYAAPGKSFRIAFSDVRAVKWDKVGIDTANLWAIVEFARDGGDTTIACFKDGGALGLSPNSEWIFKAILEHFQRFQAEERGRPPNSRREEDGSG